MFEVVNFKFMTLNGEDSKVGSPEWYELLDSVNKFAFVYQGTRITCRAESRGHANGRYWSAYKKIGGKTRKRYLGQSKDIDILKLADIGKEFKSLAQESHDSHMTSNGKLVQQEVIGQRVTQTVTQEVDKQAITIDQLEKYLSEKNFTQGGSTHRTLIAFRRWLEQQKEVNNPSNK